MLAAPLALLLGASAAPVDAAQVEGRWFTPRRDSIIEIYDCGDGTPCGRVAWFDRKTAKATHDVENKDPALRSRPIDGMVLLHSFRRGSDGWKDGAIYNPEDGNTYNAKLKRLANGQLQVKGCVGPICKAQLWTPAPAAAPSAGATP